jgi:hypothetical protein
LPNNAERFGASIGKAQYKGEKNHGSYGSVSPIRYDIAYSFCFTVAETEIDKIKDDSKIEREKNIDRRGLSKIGTD